MILAFNIFSFLFLYVENLNRDLLRSRINKQDQNQKNLHDTIPYLGKVLHEKTYVAFPSRRKMQERENCSVADTTFFDRGLNLSLTSVCVGMGLAYCFMFILLVAKAFLRPDGDSCRGIET